MICYKGKINGELITFVVEDDSLIATVIKFEDDDPQVVELYQHKINEQIIINLKKKLSNTDYIACKIAEGAATREEYAFELEEREEWRKRINEIEASLNS